MKTKTLLFASLALAMSTNFFCSCSDDDEEETTVEAAEEATEAVDYAAEIVGTYTGSLYVALDAALSVDSLSTDNLAAENTPVILTEETDGTITLKLENFAFGAMQLGDITLPGIGVTYADGVYSFVKGADQTFAFLSGALNATANIDEANSSLVNSAITLVLDVQWIGGAEDGSDMPISVVYVGGAAAC